MEIVKIPADALPPCIYRESADTILTEKIKYVIHDSEFIIYLANNLAWPS